MKINILESSALNIKFELNSNVSFANSLRRILLGEVPSTAIDLIEIYENKSVLADEMIANRLGLIPIRHSHKLIDKELCDCEKDCEKCAIIFELKVKNDTNEILPVTGKDLVYIGSELNVEKHDSLIVKLSPKQFINIRCIARKGYPFVHAKYSPVTAVTFSYDERNSKRHTKLWSGTTDDVISEWPTINQDPEVDWSPVDKIIMNMEVVEGGQRPLEVLIAGLEIFRNKMNNIYEEIV